MRILRCVSLADLVLVRLGGEFCWGGDDVHAGAASVLCFSCCFVFCALVGPGGGWGFSHRFVRCFPKFSGQHCADLRLFAHACLDFHVYVFDLRAGAGRADGGGGMLMMLMLFCMMLTAYAEDNNGGDNNDNDSCLLLSVLLRYF